MTDHSDNPVRALVQRLAEQLDGEAGAQTLALLQKLQLFTGAAQPPPAPPAPVAAAPGPTSASPRIGVWEADAEGGFDRTGALASEWRCWANVPRIPPRGRGKRVVLLGESVARGYLYDPAFTPAMALERMLATVVPDVEVIDLARIDITPRGLAPLLKALPLLAPDAIVLFAGNNWHTAEDLTLADLERAHALLPEGWDAVRRHFVGSYLPSVVDATLDRLAQAARACGDAPVAVIVPEFNLRDWHSEASFLAPVLPGGRNREWLETLEKAEHMAREESHAEVERLARRLVDLDGGTSPVSQRLLAESLLARGALAEARAAFEAARDAPCGLPIGLSPRCTATIQEAMRAGAARRGFAVVDLPALLPERFDGALPDRRSFLDYCHLTADGIRVAMGATAERLSPLLGGGPASRPEFAATPLPLSPVHEATAHVLAAVHNAHYGQDEEVLLHHCRRALAISPAAAEILLAYLDFQGRRAPRWVCRSFVELADSAAVQRYLASATPNSDDKFADHALCQAMTRALEEAGRPAAGALAELMDAEHGRAPRVDLLAPAYSSPHKWLRDGYERELRHAYLRASARSSVFLLPRAHREALQLRLTWRLPGDGEIAGPASLHVNGRWLADLGAARTWRTVTHDVPASMIHAGTNRIEVRWPARAVDWERHVRAGAARLERGARPEALLVLGEIHAFIAETRDAAA